MPWCNICDEPFQKISLRSKTCEDCLIISHLISRTKNAWTFKLNKMIKNILKEKIDK